MKRTIVTVDWVPMTMFGWWRVLERSTPVRVVLNRDTTKQETIAWAANYCRAIERHGGLAELRIKNKNGRYAKGHAPRTYGRDPRRSRG